MHTYKLDGYISYTSHRNLTADEERGINAAQRPLPDWIILPDGRKLNWRDEWNFAEKRTKAGYAILSNGIRLKYESSASPDYYKLNGNGDCTMKLVIKSELPLEFSHD